MKLLENYGVNVVVVEYVPEEQEENRSSFFFFFFKLSNILCWFHSDCVEARTCSGS